MTVDQFKPKVLVPWWSSIIRVGLVLYGVSWAVAGLMVTTAFFQALLTVDAIRFPVVCLAICLSLLIGPAWGIWVCHTAMKSARDERGWRDHWLNQERCPKCHYSTVGLTVSRCPECGETWAAQKFAS